MSRRRVRGGSVSRQTTRASRAAESKSRLTDTRQMLWLHFAASDWITGIPNSESFERELLHIRLRETLFFRECICATCSQQEEKCIKCTQEKNRTTMFMWLQKQKKKQHRKFGRENLHLSELQYIIISTVHKK